MAETRYGYPDVALHNTMLKRAIAYINEYKDFTEDIFPSIQVPTGKFQWIEFGKDAMMLKDTARALYTDADEINLNAVFNEAQTQSHSMSSPVDIKEYDEAYKGYDVYATKQSAVLNIIMRSKMKEICDKATDTANSFLSGNTIDIDGSTRVKWDASSGSDPVKDIMDLKKLVEDSCGVEPNRLIIGKSYWRTLVANDAINQLLPSNVIGNLTKPIAEELFEVPKIVIPVANYWDSGEGKFSNMFDDILIWAYVSKEDMTPSWGNTFIRQEPEIYFENKNRYVGRVGADIDYSVIVRSKGSAGYINNALT